MRNIGFEEENKREIYFRQYSF